MAVTGRRDHHAAARASRSMISKRPWRTAYIRDRIAAWSVDADLGSVVIAFDSLTDGSQRRSRRGHRAPVAGVGLAAFVCEVSRGSEIGQNGAEAVVEAWPVHIERGDEAPLADVAREQKVGPMDLFERLDRA
jgi:hypothetical protein